MNVLFVCIENSCRSQMAEGFARTYGQGVLNVWSAGSRPSGRINETAIAVMNEAGIDLSTQHSKGLEDLPPLEWDYVVLMGCGDACPFISAKRTTDWGIPDPKNLPIEQFRKIRDLIGERVRLLIHDTQNPSVETN